MDDLSCPFCFKDVPYGAVVCTGCHATIGYDEPTWLGSLMLFAGWGLMIVFGFALLFVTVFDRGFEFKSVLVLILGIASVGSCFWLQGKYLVEKEPIFHRVIHK